MAPPSPCTHSWERGLPVCLGLRPPGYVVLPGAPALGAGEGGLLQQEEPGLLPPLDLSFLIGNVTGAAQKSSEAPPAPTLQAWVMLGSPLPHPTPTSRP